MKKTYISLIILLSICFCQTTMSQTDGDTGDKYTLLTKPFNARPLNLYKGQLQFKAGYNLAVRTKSFDNNGSKIGLNEDGSASIVHTYQVNLSYGVLDFVEVGAGMNYLRQGVRGKTRNYFSGPDFITVNELTEHNGFEDLKLWVTLGPPAEIEFIDFSLIGGISVPTAKNKPDQPTHTRESLGGDSYLINYHYNLNNGEGVARYFAGADFKLTFGKFSLLGAGIFSSPTGEGESIRWDQWIDNNQFVYSEEYYLYLPDRILDIEASLHYQAISWLDIYLAYTRSSEFGGWTEQNNLKYANPEYMISYLQTGLEIQISPLVRLKEIAGYALAGQNTDAPFYILTSLSFNIFPF